MDYIPKKNNYVMNPQVTGPLGWIPFTKDMLKAILSEQLSDEEIEKMFPASTFFGLFCEKATVAEIKDALDVLKATLTMHYILLRCAFILDVPPIALAHKEALINVEEMTASALEDITAELQRYDNFKLKEGCYRKNSPQLLYTLKIPLSKSYYEWLKPRVKSYKGIGEVTNIAPYSFYNMGYDIGFKKFDSAYTLSIKVYGRVSLHSKWDTVVDLMGSIATENFLGIEKYIGLMFLADVLTSIHLMTANVQVQAGQMARPTSGDLLTDFWFRCYDTSSDNDVHVGVCEVCNGLFITDSKRKKGHARCMNKKRVIEARAKKFVYLRKEGKSEKEAAKLASINPQTAERVLREKYDL